MSHNISTDERLFTEIFLIKAIQGECFPEEMSSQESYEIDQSDETTQLIHG